MTSKESVQAHRDGLVALVAEYLTAGFVLTPERMLQLQRGYSSALDLVEAQSNYIQYLEVEGLKKDLELHTLKETTLTEEDTKPSDTQ